MAPAEYRAKAAALRAKASEEPNTRLAAEFAGLARAYLRLATQAERNLRSDVCVEFGPKPALDGGAS
jgi:hypothetical protein